MLLDARVEKILGEKALISYEELIDCTSCPSHDSCLLKKPGKCTTLVGIPSGVELAAGDTVIIFFKPGARALLSLLVFLFPSVVLIFSAIATVALGATVILSVILSICATLLAFFLLKLFQGQLERLTGAEPVIRKKVRS